MYLFQLRDNMNFERNAFVGMDSEKLILLFYMHFSFLFDFNFSFLFLPLPFTFPFLHLLHLLFHLFFSHSSESSSSFSTFSSSSSSYYFLILFICIYIMYTNIRFKKRVSDEIICDCLFMAWTIQPDFGCDQVECLD